LKIVVDSNIVFSGILNPQSNIAQILMNGSKYFEFYTINQLSDEIFEHKEKIIKISKMEFTDFMFLYNQISKRIKFVDEIFIPIKIKESWLNNEAPIDKDDLGFVSLSMFLGCHLWTGDKKLINALNKIGFHITITTTELFSKYMEAKSNYYDKN
jgi:predicted nucleic acid-binding protein